MIFRSKQKPLGRERTPEEVKKGRYVKGTWCIMRNSDLLREVMLKEIDRRKLDLFDLTTGAFPTYDAIKKKELLRRMRNLVAKEKPMPTQYQIVKLMDFLGYEVKLSIKHKEE